MQISRLIAVTAMVLIFLPGLTFHASGTKGKNINRSLMHQGKERSYVLYVPGGAYEQDTFPLIIVLHEGGGSARSMLRLTQGRFNEIAEDDGALIAYPEGLRRFWNEGRQEAISYAHRNNVDDVGFIRAMVEELIEEYPVDLNRIFVTGLSNGGLMAYRLACEMPDLIMAIASVTASMPKDVLSGCNDITGISLMVMNGTEDPLLPYEGGMITEYGIDRGRVISTEATVAHWLKKNQCPIHSKKVLLPDVAPEDETTVTHYTYNGCKPRVNVELFRIEGGGHTWPGGKQHLREDHVGKTSRDINACDEIWRFFQQF